MTKLKIIDEYNVSDIYFDSVKDLIKYLEKFDGNSKIGYNYQGDMLIFSEREESDDEYLKRMKEEEDKKYALQEKKLKQYNKLKQELGL